jgi:F0F1-type ATP synthase membrane subunit c/vacuolar-type H+-ATPase subunit K
MIAFTHRFDSTAFRNAFAPRKPRRPWLRVLFGLIGVALLVALVAVSVVVGVAMISAGLLIKLWKSRSASRVARDPRVIDGEFRAVRNDKHALPSA